MASPYYPTQQQQPERPWMGLALLLSIPLLSLILIRMLWSGSGFWYLLAGIAFLGASAWLFVARRNDQYGPTTLADMPNRLPLALMGIGMVFVILLVLPNFSDGGSSAVPAQRLQDQSARLSSQPAAVVQPTAVRVQPTAVPQSNSQTSAQQDNRSQVPLQEAPAESEPAPATNDSVSPPAGSQTYVVQDGDTLWDIADRFGVNVDAIIAANQLDNPADIQIDDELLSPPASADQAADNTVPVDEPTPGQ